MEMLESRLKYGVRNEMKAFGCYLNALNLGAI